MGGLERRYKAGVNMMTAFTKSALEQDLVRANSEFKAAQRAIGEAAGRESDWHDNAAFDYANTEFNLKMVNLGILKEKLHDVAIIEPRNEINTVDIGNTIIVKFLGEEEVETFTILGPDDAGKKPGWLSYLSPLGSSLIGKKKGETVEYSLGEEQLKHSVQIVEILQGEF